MTNESTFSLSDISEALRLSSNGHRALREAARLGALGNPTGSQGKAYLWSEESVFRAALFMTLHVRLGYSAPSASEMLKAVAIAADADEGYSGIEAAIEATRNGERWRFEIQHLSREMLPHCAFAPWDAPRTGLHTGEPPLARTVIDLRRAWAWIEPEDLRS